MLINCPECNKQISDEAESCPHCGRPILEEERPELIRRAERVSTFAGLLIIGVVLLIGGLVYLWNTADRAAMRADTHPANAEETISPSSDLAAEPRPEAPRLSARNRDLKWTHEYDWSTVEGRVTNTSSANLDGVMALVEFTTADGALITSDTSFTEYQPILPGQTSPWRVSTRWNPAMHKGRFSVHFKEYLGTEIPTKWQ